MKRVLPPLLIFVLALSVRLYYLEGIEAYPKFELIRNRLDDQVVFDAWAKAIVAGERFDYSTTGHHFAYWASQTPGVYPQAPLYPFFLSLLYEIFGFRYDLVRAVQMLLGAMACAGLAILARRWLQPVTAWSCGAGLALYGPQVFYEGTFLRAGLFTAVAIAGFWATAFAAETRGRRRLAGSFAAGLALAAGVLLRPNYLLVAAGALSWLTWRISRGTTREPTADGAPPRRAVALALLGLVLPLLPIVMINSLRSGGPAFLSSNGPYIFFISNVHDAPGTTAGVSPYYHEVKASGPPGEVDLLREALRDITRHPGAFLALQWRKTVAFFAPQEIPNNLSYAMAAETNPRLAVPRVELWLLLPLAAAGLAISFFEPRRYLLLYIFLGGYWVGTVVFYVLARLRLPVVPVLLIFAGLALETGWRVLREGRVARVALAAGVIVLVTMWWRPSPPVHRTSDYQMAAAARFSLAEDFERDGRRREAWESYARTVALYPDFDRALKGLERLAVERPPDAPPEVLALCADARRALEAEDPATAERLLGRAISLSPESAAPYLYLSNVFYLSGEPRRAMRALEEAIARDPYDAVQRRNLARLRLEVASRS